MISRLILACFCLIALNACKNTPEENKAEVFLKQEVKLKLSDYLMTYALHQEFDKLLGYYAQDAQLINVIKGDKAKGIKQIKNYFNWEDKKLTYQRSESAFVVENIWIDGLNATVVGYLMPFEYDGVDLGPWKTVMLFEFDQELKIIKQTDYINYTPKAMFNNSPNSNLDIKVPNYLIKSSAIINAN